MWSPKAQQERHLNPFYEFMREVAPGDLVFSFADTRIKAIGIASRPCYDCPKPRGVRRGGPGLGRCRLARRRAVARAAEPDQAEDHMEVLRRYLPAKYSPLQADGQGLQSVYLTELPARAWRMRWFTLMGREAARTTRRHRTIAGCRTLPIRESPAQAQADGKRIWPARSEQDTRSRSRRSGRSFSRGAGRASSASASRGSSAPAGSRGSIGRST